MSDDEGPGDFGDDIAADAVDVDADVEEDADEVLELEDAAGTDDESEGEDEDATAAAAEESETRAEFGSRAAPSARARVDPVLRASNRGRIVRVVPPEERVTDNRLHRTEAAYILAMRAKQIDKHARAFTDTAGLTDAVAIAYKELFDRRCPLRLRRKVGVGPGGEIIVEEWDVRTMALPALTPPASLRQ
jgi:DNA-directed RNA polymerase subunit K/omega